MPDLNNCEKKKKEKKSVVLKISDVKLTSKNSETSKTILAHGFLAFERIFIHFTLKRIQIFKMLFKIRCLIETKNSTSNVSSFIYV